MTRFVIDAKTLIVIARGGRAVQPVHQLVAPNAIRSAAMELLLQAVRRNEITQGEALEIHERITAVKLRLLGDRVSRRAAWNLAHEHDWEDLRDAEYLAVTQLQADALVTQDSDLAAKAEGLVTVAPLSALFSA